MFLCMLFSLFNSVQSNTAGYSTFTASGIALGSNLVVTRYFFHGPIDLVPSSRAPCVLVSDDQFCLCSDPMCPPSITTYSRRQSNPRTLYCSLSLLRSSLLLPLTLHSHHPTYALFFLFSCSQSNEQKQRKSFEAILVGQGQ